MKVCKALVFCLSLVIGGGLALATATAQASSLNGTYVIKDQKQAQKSINIAIERTVADVNRLFRSRARNALKSKQSLCKKLALTVTSAVATITCHTNGSTASAPSSGASKKFQHNGKTAYLTHKVVGSRIVQTIKSDKGIRKATYTLSADGKTLTVSIALESDKLDTPLRYTLTYVRRS